MDARTQKSELTRAAIVGAALDLASAEGLEAISLQAVADRIGLSKSGVFSRVGSREALQRSSAAVSWPTFSCRPCSRPRDCRAWARSCGAG